MVFALIAFPAWRKMDFNLDWSFKWKDLVMIGVMFSAILLTILPMAIWIEFAKSGFTKKPYLIPVYFVAIWFAPALVEEILFRGAIQNILIGWFKPVIGVMLASLIFGLSHVNDQVRDFNVPNWTYVALAGFTGIAYGLVAYKRNLQSSATLHWVVDFVWWLLFKGGK